jgi:hypothetical protein
MQVPSAVAQSVPNTLTGLPEKLHLAIRFASARKAKGRQLEKSVQWLPQQTQVLKKERGSLLRHFDVSMNLGAAAKDKWITKTIEPVETLQFFLTM